MLVDWGMNILKLQYFPTQFAMLKLKLENLENEGNNTHTLWVVLWAPWSYKG
jgi:hypothetical protein